MSSGTSSQCAICVAPNFCKAMSSQLSRKDGRPELRMCTEILGRNVFCRWECVAATVRRKGDRIVFRKRQVVPLSTNPCCSQYTTCQYHRRSLFVISNSTRRFSSRQVWTKAFAFCKSLLLKRDHWPFPASRMVSL